MATCLWRMANAVAKAELHRAQSCSAEDGISVQQRGLKVRAYSSNWQGWWRAARRSAGRAM